MENSPIVKGKRRPRKTLGEIIKCVRIWFMIKNFITRQGQAHYEMNNLYFNRVHTSYH